MNREQLLQYVSEQYSVDEEHPWEKYPDNIVFRHQNNKKWFALIMPVSKSKLGLLGTDMIDILNVKCDPIVVGSLRNERGFFPAYHMNKINWITVALDGSVSDEKVKWLLDMSFDLTAVKLKRKSNKTITAK